MSAFLDDYEIRARLFPALLSVVTLPVVVITLGFRQYPLVTGLLALFTAVGGPFLLATIVGERGRRLQERLFRDWGGSPTVALLRLGDQRRLDPQRLQRRTKLAQAWANPLPSRDDELSNAAHADQVYESAISYLREQTRDRKVFPLVFTENCTYGFHRNLLAVRPFSIAVSAFASVALIALISANLRALDFSWTDLAIGLLICVALLCYWCVYPTERRVRAAAEIYAQRLLDSALILPISSASRP
jgi:hypothetical protein